MSDYMVASLCPLSAQVGTSHSVMSVGSRKTVMNTRAPKIPSKMRMVAPLTSINIEEIVESFVGSWAQLQRKDKPCQSSKVLLF